MQIISIYNKFKECGVVTTDTRTLKGGEMFFALKGENFDGNEYALKALELGARYAVVNVSSQVAAQDDPRLIKVEDTLKTLQELARWHRSMIFVDGKHLPVVALTGTNGKTTTKELVRAVLSARYNVTATEGNLNNSIGVPLTLLKVNDQTQIAVVEMGASHPGDIKELVDIACPNFGLITNVGKAHLLGFGSFEGVKATKGELYDYLRRTADKAFINVDNPHLCQMASDRNMQHDPERSESLLIPYGLEYQGASVLPSSAEEPFLRIMIPAFEKECHFERPEGDLCHFERPGGVEKSVIIKTNLVGSYNADNVMAALAVGQHFGVSFEEAVAAIEAYIPSNNRSQMTRTSRNTLIVDAYNANPTSMAAALENFSNVAAEVKVAMLGDMLELGEDSIAEHVAVIRSVASRDFSQTFFVGKEFTAAFEAVKAEAGESVGQFDGMIFFATSDELAKYLTAHPLEGATILIKGSRGTRMEKVIPAL